MDNQNMETNAQGADNVQNHESAQGAQNEKLFTQDDVNRIVGERLARVKNTQTSEDTSERMHELDLRERKLTARERLADLGISKDLLPLVNCTSKETMEESINLIAGQFGTVKQGMGYRISTGVSGANNSSGHSKSLSDDEIRSAMGLKGR